MSLLYPPGISQAGDLPYHLHDAIAKGLAFVAFDELPSEEHPPKEIWLDTDKLTDWFKAVEKRRDEKYGGKGNKEIEDAVENDAARSLIGG